MDLPASAAQLVIALLFIVPGSIYQAVRQRLRGPAPDDVNFSNKLCRALGVSTALMAIYVALLGGALLPLVEQSSAAGPSWRGAVKHASELGWISIGLLIVVPALLAFCDYVRVSGSINLRNLTYDPTPRAWDYAFADIEPCYLRVLTVDGVWLGGWFGSRSFISSFPEPREIYIETAHQMQPDGSIGEAQSWSAGMYIRCDDIRAVELLREPVASDDDAEEDQHG